MALIWMEGDILDSQAHALVNPVNCVGVMGKGLAKSFAAKYPEMEKRYKRACARQALRVGHPAIDRHQSPWIVNFPTKNHWRHSTELEWIIEGLSRLETLIERFGVLSIAVPALGCGHGGLRWPQVAPALTMFATNQQIPVYLYAPMPDYAPPPSKST